MDDADQWYRWRVLFRNADDSDTDVIWLIVRDGDEAYDELEREKPGARFIKVLDKIKLKEGE